MIIKTFLTLTSSTKSHVLQLPVLLLIKLLLVLLFSLPPPSSSKEEWILSHGRTIWNQLSFNLLTLAWYNVLDRLVLPPKANIPTPVSLKLQINLGASWIHTFYFIFILFIYFILCFILAVTYLFEGILENIKFVISWVSLLRKRLKEMFMLWKFWKLISKPQGHLCTGMAEIMKLRTRPEPWHELFLRVSASHARWPAVPPPCQPLDSLAPHLCSCTPLGW